MNSKAIMNTYGRYPVRLVRGSGARAWDDTGKEYLDFISGIAVNTLGHAHPALVRAISEQAQTMLHCSNLFHIPAQEKLAEKLTRLAGIERAFFCNSGAEANEAAIKLMRKYWYDQHSPRRTIITATRSFHGRTLNTLTATGQDKVKTGFDPLPPGFIHVPLGNMNALKQAVGDDTAGILLEPVQGEGGVNVVADAYLRGVRKLCNDTGILMVLDEVQTGVGRTGEMFGFEHTGMRPDILTLAKGLGGGVPIGAMLASESVAASFGPGTHGCTFGGNPLSCTAALTVIDVIEQEGLLENARTQGGHLLLGLKAIQRTHPVMQEIRGQGLLIGAELSCDVAETIARCRESGLLLLPAGPKVLRFLPPLNVTSAEIDEALTILGDCLGTDYIGTDGGSS
ncbi:MAG: acetylornithine transaminase [Mariprofundaceae bacterium]|nr:acetylornithine transaminase [Mariprofundaceae bacterium]